MGIDCLSKKNEAGDQFFQFQKKQIIPNSLTLEEPYFGPTIQSLLLNVLSPTPRTFTLHNPCIEPEIFATVDLLTHMGADITYNYSDKTTTIKSRPKLSDTRFTIPSDPNTLVSYSVMTSIRLGTALLSQWKYLQISTPLLSTKKTSHVILTE